MAVTHAPATSPLSSTIISVVRMPITSSHEALQPADIGGQQVQVVEPSHVHTARGKPHRLVLERRREVGRRLVPLGLVVDLHRWPSGV